tara:strand:+ start:4676 stop:4909 length:234 start_codon:yes stop_codon:yes gene_type:complete
MPSFYLQSIDDDGGTTTKSFDSCYIDEVIDYVDDFLRGSGFAYDELKLVKASTPDESSKSFLREQVNEYRRTQSSVD